MKRAIVRCAVLAFFLAALPMAAQSGAWSAVGSSGDIDEASLGIFAVNLASLQHQAGAVGSVVARYNVTNTFGGGITDLPPWDTLEMTYLDPGATSSVSATLFQVNRCTGAISFVCGVSSTDSTAPSCVSCNFPAAAAINFAQSLYFVEVRVTRTANNVFPQLIGLRIF